MHLLISMPGGAEWILLLIGLCILLLPIMALVEIIRSQFEHPENKIIWVVVVLMLPFIGSILFWTIGRSQKVKQY
jgi:predicted permease